MYIAEFHRNGKGSFNGAYIYKTAKLAELNAKWQMFENGAKGFSIRKI